MAIDSPAHPAWPELRTALLREAQDAIVIWDFDGVIGDTEPFHERTYGMLLQAHGHETGPDWFTPFVGHQEKDTWRLFGEAGWPVLTATEELIAERRETFLQLCLEELHPSWLVKELALTLTEVAREQWCVSAGDPHTVHTLLQAWDLADLIPPFPREVGEPKGAALTRLWAQGPSLVFEDNPGYLAAAHAAGASCVAVQHGLSSPATSPVLATVGI